MKSNRLFVWKKVREISKDRLIKELRDELAQKKEIIRQLKDLVEFTEISAAAGMIPASNLKSLIENKEDK
ncbi:MAG: hypothetical protein P9X22_00605 [Candidatus Zapsychrus exili]|nr:hypothetical protein [Candidatus Zapsychrus exili]